MNFPELAVWIAATDFSDVQIELRQEHSKFADGVLWQARLDEDRCAKAPAWRF